MSKLTKEFHFPAPAEMHAIEAAARRAQMEEMLRLARLAAKGVKTLVVRAANGVAAKVRRTGVAARHGA